MAFTPTKQSKISRISESEGCRIIEATKDLNSDKKLGKFCVACNMYFNYLRPQDKLCKCCKERYELLSFDK